MDKTEQTRGGLATPEKMPARVLKTYPRSSMMEAHNEVNEVNEGGE